jgi:hypothetical protein
MTRSDKVESRQPSHPPLPASAWEAEMKTVIFTSDNHQWLLKGFLHQWAKYGLKDSPLVVVGYTRPDFLPEDIKFVSLGRFEDYPVDKWSNGVIQYLRVLEDELFLFMLEDYWLIRPINVDVFNLASQFMIDHPEVGRFDVAADRMFNHSAQYKGSVGVMDICQAKGDYSLSFQASIYRKAALMDALRPNESPWQSELDGSNRLNKLAWDVVGSYQWISNYMIVMNKGKLDRSGSWMYPARTLSQSDWGELDKLGYTTEPGETK